MDQIQCNYQKKLAKELKKKKYSNYLFKFIFNKYINLKRYKNLKKILQHNKNIKLLDYKKICYQRYQHGQT